MTGVSNVDTMNRTPSLSSGGCDRKSLLIFRGRLPFDGRVHFLVHSWSDHCRLNAETGQKTAFAGMRTQSTCCETSFPHRARFTEFTFASGALPSMTDCRFPRLVHPGCCALWVCRCEACLT